MIKIVILQKANFTVFLCIAYIIFLMGCNNDKRHSPKLVTVWHGNLRDGGIVFSLPSSAGYQRSKEGSRIRYIWEDDNGREYSFVVVIVHDKDTTVEEAHSRAIEQIKLGRKREGWRLIEEGSYQTFSGYRGKRILFRKGERIAEWIYFSFENYPGGVVIYWFSTEKRYHTDQKVIDSFIKYAKIVHPTVLRIEKTEVIG